MVVSYFGAYIYKYNSARREEYNSISVLVCLMQRRGQWKAYINYLLKDFGGVFLLSCNYDVKDCKINSSFYRELLQWWADLRITFSTKPPISYNIIRNNKDIKIDNKTIYYSNYIKAGILLINHLQFNKNNIQSYNSAKSKGLRHTNFLVWSGVRSCPPEEFGCD